MTTTGTLLLVGNGAAILSSLCLLVVIAVIIIYRKSKTVNDRYLLWLTIANLMFALPLAVPKEELACGDEIAVFTMHAALITLETAFIASVMYTMLANTFIPKVLEVVSVLGAIIAAGASLGVLTPDCPKPQQIALAIFQLLVLGLDFILCISLLVSIRHRKLIFTRKRRQVEDEIAKTQSAAPQLRRQLQILQNLNADFNTYVYPVRLYPVVFVVFSLPQLLFLQKPDQTSIAAAAMVLAWRGAGFAIVYFAHAEARSELKFSRLLARAKLRVFGSPITFSDEVQFISETDDSYATGGSSSRHTSFNGAHYQAVSTETEDL